MKRVETQTMENVEVAEWEMNNWQNFLDAWQSYTTAKNDLLDNTPSLVDLVRQATINPHQRLAALDIARFIETEQLQQLFSNLLAIASYLNGSGAETARELILALPREWVLANIEVQAEHLLADNDDINYRGLFILYLQLDLKLAKALAERALASLDRDIKETGEYFMEVLDKDTLG